MKLKAYAKINLCLKVFPKTTNFKHPIDSIFFLYKKLFDKIKVKKSNKLEIIYKNKNLDYHIEKQLIIRLLTYLQNKYDLNINYKFVIYKKIPYGSGLGSSSNVVAKIMNFILFRTKNIIIDLKEIALQFGSDIPFFLSGLNIARVFGYGENVVPIYNWKPKPKIHLNSYKTFSKDVFAKLDKDVNYQSSVDVDMFIKQKLYKYLSNNQSINNNDLTKYIIRNNARLGDEIKKYGPNAFFTGAGSTIVTIKE